MQKSTWAAKSSKAAFSAGLEWNSCYLRKQNFSLGFLPLPHREDFFSWQSIQSGLFQILFCLGWGAANFTDQETKPALRSGKQQKELEGQVPALTLAR